MTERDRFIATLRFERPDRVPFNPGHGRKSTLAAWHRQGLPEDVVDYQAYVRERLGIEPAEGSEREEIGVDFRMIPRFEEKIIERRPAVDGSHARGTLVVQDWKGNVCEISDEYDTSYLREAIDFVTRRWIKCPVETREDFEAMKARYRIDTVGRFPINFSDRARRLKRRSFVSGITIPGPFWQLREWLGFENLCLLVIDDGELVCEMIEFWTEFVARMLRRVLAEHLPDFVMINEDMAYKEKVMISPAMARRFLLPCWRAWGEIVRGAGVPIYEVDSDGHVGALIPLWIEAGFNANTPQEVAAGNDLPLYRRTFGTAMAYEGGVDKRAIARGGRAIRNEIDRLKGVVDAGGYIPSCDHGIPADVTWANFVDYCRLLARATGWL